MWSLGGRAVLNDRFPWYTYNGEKKKGSRTYRLHISFYDESIVPFRASSSPEKFRPSSLTPGRRIVGIEYVGNKEAQCIQVDSPSQMYITDDFVVTHNTRLSATFPDPLFLDLENGAATARREGVNRILIPTDANAASNVLSIINRLASLPVQDGRILFKPEGADQAVPVATLVIDSLDALQQSIKMFRILRGRTKMELQDWDMLLNELQPLVLAWNALPIHVVVVAHSKREEGEEGRPGDMNFSVQGSLKAQIPRWFDYILHIAAGADGKRYVVTQPTISRGYRYTAKDRHGRLKELGKNGIIELESEDGYPDNTIANRICGIVS